MHIVLNEVHQVPLTYPGGVRVIVLPLNLNDFIINSCLAGALKLFFLSVFSLVTLAGNDVSLSPSHFPPGQH